MNLTVSHGSRHTHLFTEKEGIPLDYQFGGTTRGHINGSSIIMCMPLNFVPSVAKV